MVITFCQKFCLGYMTKQFAMHLVALPGLGVIIVTNLARPISLTWTYFYPGMEK